MATTVTNLKTTTIKHQSGRSMVEVLGVLAIIGVLSFAGLWGYSSAMGKHKKNEFISQINSVEMAIRINFANNKDYIELNNDLAVKMGIIPEEMVKNNVPKHIFNGNFTVRVGFYNQYYFAFDIYNIPKEACVYYLSNGVNDRITHLYSSSSGKTHYAPLSMESIFSMCSKDLTDLKIAYIP